MKKLLAAMALALPLSANAADFTGLNVWIGGQYTDGETEFFDSLDNAGADFDDTDFGLTLGADYGFGVSDDAVILVGASWSDKSDMGSISGADGSLSTELDPSYMLYVAPGVKVGDSSLLYAKLSYSEAEGTLSVQTSEFSGSLSQDDKAVGYGVGFRSYLTDNVFLNAEIEHIEYEYSLADTLTIDAPITRASVTVGMSF